VNDHDREIHCGSQDLNQHLKLPNPTTSTDKELNRENLIQNFQTSINVVTKIGSVEYIDRSTNNCLTSTQYPSIELFNINQHGPNKDNAQLLSSPTRGTNINI